ncbi:hypothetical protein, partial [Pseudobacteroides cellulosolvens]|uniref:hypothetical protein n=1 Tax=Pseudobacteroides cellulosolvens TaxID=35825 RepID=UPI001A9A49AA
MCYPSVLHQIYSVLGRLAAIGKSSRVIKFLAKNITNRIIFQFSVYVELEILRSHMILLTG